MPMMATTIMSSIRVKPFVGRHTRAIAIILQRLA
jgi:hypothetical protein